jgi:transcription elongation factor
MSSEVTTGYGNLMGYELYDIVALNENECAVVIVVGTEKLRVINHMSVVRDVLPQELRGKRNAFSARSTGFDIQQNAISVGDTVKVTSGAHAKLSGTVKQMMKGTLWLHSNAFLKNSGIFVVKTRNCVVAGGKMATPVLSAGYKGVLLPTPQHPAAGGSLSVQGMPSVGAGAMSRGGSNSTGNGRNGGGGRDPMIGKTIRITSGGNKGLLAQVVDATPTHYSVELLAKLKKIVVERSKAVVVGDEKGSIEKPQGGAGYRSGGAGGGFGFGGGAGAGGGDFSASMGASTPFLVNDTPMHYGGETPRNIMGGETPAYGGETPGSKVWGANQDDEDLLDQMDSSSNNTSMLNTPGDSQHGSTSSRNPNNHHHGGGGVGGWSLTSSAMSSIHGNSGMSSSLHSGASTPGSMSTGGGSSNMADAGSYSMRSDSTATGAANTEEVTLQHWRENMVVELKDGPHRGQLGVVQQRPNMDVSIRIFPFFIQLVNFECW